MAKTKNPFMEKMRSYSPRRDVVSMGFLAGEAEQTAIFYFSSGEPDRFTITATKDQATKWAMEVSGSLQAAAKFRRDVDRIWRDD